MKDEVERFLDAALFGPVVPPQTPARAKDLEPSDDTFPCPNEPAKRCATKEWLKSRRRAGFVYGYLDALAERGSDQENDLGCALGWADDWIAATAAFASAKDKAKTDKQRQRADNNRRVAERDG
ncbi:MAG TPA: hypothetical protein VGO80_10950 [Solirubrobacteraceae bacterium]|jgi:hypothetical protein|nr:hypothetical protein [Solirubrobacteraceae bacterium]